MVSSSSMSMASVKHEKFWFNDGNIILSTTTTTASDSVSERGCDPQITTDSTTHAQAADVDPDKGKKRRRTEEGSAYDLRSTPSLKHVLFRVHKSILSKHSPVFDGMFALPDPSNHQERRGSDMDLVDSHLDDHKPVNKMFDDVPIVELSDSSERVEQLLEVFYDLFPLTLKARDSDTPIHLFSLMEMARKYEVEAISKHIVKRIEWDWPQTLKKWDKIDEPSMRFNGGQDSADALKTELPEPIAAINFAKRFGVYDILPAAFLELLRTPYENDWDVFYTQDKRAPVGKTRVKAARWHLLSREDHLLLGKLRESVKRQPRKALPQIPDISIRDDCSDKQHDPHGFKECCEYLQLIFCAADDVLRVSQAYCRKDMTDWYTRFVLCESCYIGINSALRKMRSQTWDIVKDCISAHYNSDT